VRNFLETCYSAKLTEISKLIIVIFMIKRLVVCKMSNVSL